MYVISKTKTIALVYTFFDKNKSNRQNRSFYSELNQSDFFSITLVYNLFHLEKVVVPLNYNKH